MKDFKFGNLIYESRKKLNLSQSDLASKLGVTNKAVSKWENGNAKPNIEILKKISLLFNTSIDELIDIKDNNDKKHITKIVITGGPCAGKTTALSKIQDKFTEMGYTVILIPETPTELIPAGININNCKSNFYFQQAIIKLQLEKERIYSESVQNLKNNKILIICDRGTMDGKAYVNDFEFRQLLKSINKSEIELRDSYDAVFHLVTAANGAKEFYTLDNNKARKESLEEAIKLDNSIIEAYTGHPHLRVIDNSTDFNLKIKKLIEEIKIFLGEPVSYEIERKFLIEYPDIKWLNSYKKCERIEIIQTYLKSNTDDEIRIRQRGINGNYLYFKTIKKNINNIKRIETEQRLTKEEYLDLMMQVDTSKKQIRKTRYCLLYKNQYFEIDIFPFWKDKAILELELSHENDEINPPKQLKIIKEVTHDKRYKNYNLANND